MALTTTSGRKTDARRGLTVDIADSEASPTKSSKAGRREIAQAHSQLLLPTAWQPKSMPRLKSASKGPELVITVVNVSPEDIQGLDTNLYEVRLSGRRRALPSRFSLMRLKTHSGTTAWWMHIGVNGGVNRTAWHRCLLNGLIMQAPEAAIGPSYWDATSAPGQPDLTFVGFG